LLDTGADVNVLPYRLGLELGGIWDDQQTALQLSGNLANYEARGIILRATVAHFPETRLAFAWTRAEDVPLILGQVNFFLEFDICFWLMCRKSANRLNCETWTFQSQTS
jgi:hypothetical protein